MAGSRPPGEKRHDEDTLNASRRSDVSKYDPFWEPPPDERQAAWNKIAEAVEAYSVSTDAPTLASLLREEAIVHFYMAEALERITDDPHQKSRAIEIKRSEAAQVEPFPPRAVISEATYEEIRELVESGRRESVWEAFHTNPSLASDLIAEDAKIDQTLRQAAALTLTFLLQEQARVQLSMTLALARIADEPHRKSRAIEILFHEAEQLTDRETLCSALRCLKSVEPRAVIPSLIAFLRKADDVPARDAALETLEHLILRGFAADASESPPTLTSECIIGSVESPGVLISPNLTIIPSPGQTLLVPRKDASQEASLGPTATLSPDLNLSSSQFGEDVDLAQAAFVSARPTTQAILTDLEQVQVKLAELHAPIVERLRSTIGRLHQVKSLGSYDENAKAATMVYRLAKSCGMDLTYKGERVALGCIDREDYKAGVFRLRTFSGKPKFVYDRRDFPPLDLTPSDDPTSP